MLNMNNYVNLLGGRFENGFTFTLFKASTLGANPKHRTTAIAAGVLESPGTGHWPFVVAAWHRRKGVSAGWEATLLGFTFGSLMVHDLDDKGNLKGPDKRLRYFFFMGFNHQHKTLGEIINYG